MPIKISSVAMISIHSLRVEGDAAKRTAMPQYPISIHSLRVEGDMMVCMNYYSAIYFNPLPPCGGRPGSLRTRIILRHFNPLPPCGGRPQDGRSACNPDVISIHSLRVEGDRMDLRWWNALTDFNPLPPCGGRHGTAQKWASGEHISIHSLRVEGDAFVGVMALWG